MNTIYLVRHGENVANITQEFSSRLVDYSLTPKGILQAQQTATFFKGKHIHAVYSSPLKRARETADIIANELALPVTVIEQFREVNVGALERQPPSEKSWSFHNHIFRKWFLGHHDVAFPEGEDYLTLLQRMRTGLLAATHDRENQNVVIVGHGGIFTITMKDICPTANMEAIIRHHNHNCSISKVELSIKGGNPVGVLRYWADKSHLTGEAAEPAQKIPLR